VLVAAGLDPDHVAERLRKALGIEPLRKSARLTKREASMMDSLGAR
jgi:hypothetical protein